MKKKKYSGMSISQVELDNETTLLVESSQEPRVSIQENVAVDDYTFGFSDGDSDSGFEVEFGD